ncbi:TFIIH basal transcription factor complex, subunit SSL1 [Xylona heveae TC161]|uniref:General transcription and DNA repair factor IIH n=1 Tax=Xylona heveae (strain CBS 132557 / TC161) TaxID=1328760 RepID=A0A165AJX4_XYLHT|nr:TFIIH basal transcription factor complex, subunit SSL1 [Xylona heveae TC161]KZF20604.1 TFIIH basal transcription factor complex, subunit SSL1 [Xylona heveae TC161]
MADSDGEYIDEALSDDDTTAQQGTRGGDYGTRSASNRAIKRRRTDGRGGGTQTQPKARWEDIHRSWEHVVEGADGSISSTVEGLLEAGKRKRLLRDTTPLQRGIIRHMILVLDLSESMAEKDLRPTRYLLTLRYAHEFVTEFFEQNPISQLGVIGMKDGLAVRISDMSGNPSDHISAIEGLRPQDPKGDPSLQNALDMARAALFHAPSHGTREVLIIFGALYSSDPGDIRDTIKSIIADKIRVSIVGLAAQVAICQEICSKTNGGDDTVYGVALNEQHFRELFFESTTPPVTRSAKQAASSLLQMGFPSRIVEQSPSLCACHSQLTRGGYLCSRCQSKVCSLPTECPACGLTLILSTHLARSYHHLFPLRNWHDVSWEDARKSKSTHCFACQVPFPPIPDGGGGGKGVDGVSSGEGVSSNIKSKPGAGSGSAPPISLAAPATGGATAGLTSRYECEVCKHHFCIECDLFAHEVVHNCPGCQSGAPIDDGGGAVNGQVGQHATDGNGSGNGNGNSNGNDMDLS